MDIDLELKKMKWYVVWCASTKQYQVKFGSFCDSSWNQDEMSLADLRCDELNLEDKEDA